MIKKKIAVFVHEFGFQYVASLLVEGSTQLTEYVEVDFPELPKAGIIVGQIAALDAMAVAARNEYQDKLAGIERRKQELLALTCETEGAMQ